jgi:hypothetical protein
MPEYKILVKYATRGRPERFFDGMESIYQNVSRVDGMRVLITADMDDASMVGEGVLKQIEKYPNAKIIHGTSESKIHATNRDMELLPDQWKDWDIIVNFSDDQRFIFYGWDEIIRQELYAHGLDTLLHIPDQDAGAHLAVMYIAGRPFYDRFGFIYNPAYKSLFCDNEVMEIAQKLGKYRYSNTPGVFVHLNAAYGHSEKDAMFLEQQEIGWTIDQETYNERKANNFYL